MMLVWEFHMQLNLLNVAGVWLADLQSPQERPEMVHWASGRSSALRRLYSITNPFFVLGLSGRWNEYWTQRQLPHISPLRYVDQCADSSHPMPLSW